MTESPSPPPPRRRPLVLIASYVLDWAVLIALALVANVMGSVTPNKRPFSLTSPHISFPFTEHEAVPSWLLLVSNSAIPIVIILAVCLILVPGSTVPPGTPKSLIWKRKLWELHVGWLGLCLALSSAWFITNGMKNLFGKPRPDMLSRCQPDVDHFRDYVVGGIAGTLESGQLVSADICKGPDKALLDDGFRSFPSGHSSSAAAGLIYLSLFLASKFAVIFPFIPPTGSPVESSAFSAFPSRLAPAKGTSSAYEPIRSPSSKLGALDIAPDPAVSKRVAIHSRTVTAARRQAAAPPIYLLVLTALPFFAAIFIASSRWFDFRHHGFDIMFGFLIGTATSIYAFRFYHLPISQGAGWSWGPRSGDKAFWAGVGSYSYATGRDHYLRPGDEEEAMPSADADDGHSTSAQIQTVSEERRQDTPRADDA